MDSSDPSVGLHNDSRSAATRAASLRFHLLITDLVMPGGVTGHELAGRPTGERPERKVIHSSGYRAGLFSEGPDLIPGRNFLAKPYDASSVVTMISQVSAEGTEMLTA